MRHYPFHVGDYIRATAHLDMIEDCVYRRLIDLYMETEQPIPNETQQVIRRLRLGSSGLILDTILQEFFTLEADNCWHNSRCDAEISEFKRLAEVSRINGKLGGRPKKTQQVILANPEITQQEPSGLQPIPNTQYPKAISSPKGSRLQQDLILTAKWGNVALEIRSDFDNDDVRVEFEAFKDYWTAKPGKDGVKLDWLATWRNWCRNSKRKGNNHAA